MSLSYRLYLFGRNLLLFLELCKQKGPKGYNLNIIYANYTRWGFGLVGPRGVGKSTMILQYIKENRDKRHMLYVAADHLYFSTHTLINTIGEFVKDGGKQIFIDEIHKYENWSRELKLIYDSHPDLS